MKFQEIRGAAVIKVSSEPLKALQDYINTELADEEVKLEKARAVDIALAVGMAEGEMGSTDERADALNFHSVDRENVLKALIEQRHPEAEAGELRELLIKYIEGGLEVIGSEIDERGFFDYDRYF